MRTARIAAWLMVIGLSACHAGVRPDKERMEAVIARLATRPDAPTVDDFAAALGLGLGKPTLSDDGVSSSRFGTYAYPVQANAWGIVGIHHAFTLGAGGLTESTTLIELFLDGTYCVRPERFPASWKFIFMDTSIPHPDSVGVTPDHRYLASLERNRGLQISVVDEKACARSLVLLAQYGKGGDAAGLGPAIADSPSASELTGGYNVHPPFSGQAFLQQILTLIRAHDGYVLPQDLDGAFGLKIPPLSTSYKYLESYDFTAYRQWHMKLHYEVIRGIQPGTPPNSPRNLRMSSLEVAFHPYTFPDASGHPACLPAEAVDAALREEGYGVSNERHSRAITERDFGKRGSTAHIRMDLQPYAAGDCAVGLGIYAEDRPPAE